jgi:hypothetical protein
VKKLFLGKTKPSTRFRMPTDFPLEVHDKISGMLVKYKDTHPTQWLSFGVAWRGLKNRYRATDEYHKEFTDSIMKHGNSPSPEERYGQERALFGFFTSAISTVDCFFYSTYWIGAILKPGEFPSDPKKLKYMYPRDVVERFNTNFPGDDLTNRMIVCVCEPTYNEMRDMRDVLGHRGELPRRFDRGGERDGMATMPTNPKDPSDQWRYDLSIDEKTTATRRQWLSDTLRDLTSVAADFCEKNMTRKE